MSETVSDPEKNAIPIGSPPAVTRRMFMAATAIVFALLLSFLFTRYFAYRNVQENFYGQALVPAKQAFDFHLVDQDGKAFQLGPNAWESRVVHLRIYPLSKCLPHYIERSGKGLSGASRQGSHKSAGPLRQCRSAS